MAWKSLQAKIKWDNGEHVIKPIVISSKELLILVLKHEGYLTKEHTFLSIYISNNGIDYSEDLLCELVILPMINAVYPTIGSEFGGTSVQIIGEHFNNDITLCKFGSIEVPATFVSDTIITCISPQPEIPIVRIRLFCSPDMMIEENEVYYQYGETDFVIDFTPKEYCITGDIEIELKGNFYSFSSNIEVYFGDTKSDAITLIDSNTITATLPSITEEKYVQVTIKTDTREYTAKSLFHYRDYGKITSVTPNHGPSSGNYPIYIKGENLQYNVITHCVIDEVLVSIVYLNKTMIVCAVPSHDAGSVNVKLKFNGLYSSEELVFKYDKDIVIHELDTTFIGLSGGIPVKVKGENFPREYEISLVIGGVMVIPQYISSTEIEFVAPKQIEYGKKEIKVSSNGYTYVDMSNVHLYYYSTMHAIEVLPVLIPTGKENEILVRGENFPMSSL
jgi:hypothetical protein